MSAQTHSLSSERIGKAFPAIKPYAQKCHQWMEDFVSSVNCAVTQGTKLLTEAKPTAHNIVQDVKYAVTDLSPIDSKGKTHGFIVESYMWSSLCLIALSLGQLLSVHILSKPINAFFTPGSCLLLAYVLLPLYLHLHIKKAELNDDSQRTAMLFAAGAIGLASGPFLLSLKYAFLAPALFIVPLSMGISVGLVGPQLAPKRPAFLVAVVTLFSSLFIVWGLLVGAFGLSYLLWLLAVVAVSLGDIQLKIFLHAQYNNLPQTQLYTFLIFFFAETLFLLFLGYAESAESAKSAELA